MEKETDRLKKPPKVPQGTRLSVCGNRRMDLFAFVFTVVSQSLLIRLPFVVDIYCAIKIVANCNFTLRFF